MSQCPKCGCQVEDPFTGTVVIHDIERCGSLAATPGSAPFPGNVTIARNEFLASDEWPWSVSFCGQSFYGDSPEHCFEKIAAALADFAALKAAVEPFVRK